MPIYSRTTGANAMILLAASMNLYGCGGGSDTPPGSSSASSSVASSSSSASSVSSSLSSSSTSSASSTSSVSSSISSSSVSSITVQQRTLAATQTAQNNAQCTAIQPFYWEIGDRSSMLGGVTAGSGTTPNATTAMLIASASKWIFGTYVVQAHTTLTANDLAGLNMTAGYTNLTYGSCLRLQQVNQDAETVHQCFTSLSNNGSGTNGDLDPTTVGKFFYGGGHFQWLSDTDLNLGADNNVALHDAIAAQLGAGFNFTYDSPQLAAGVQTTAQDYGFLLREILSNQLLMHDALGTHTVCTNPATCATALSTPIPQSESWHYSLGHWVEDDPTVGDGAFSSPGAFGFYPWIDATKTYYGVLARYSTGSTANDSVALDSVQCGRQIRKAWMTAVAQ